MSLEDFTEVATLLVGTDCPVREIPYYFNVSIRLQSNEIDSERHLSMKFPEFLEGMCRVIDKASPMPPDEVINLLIIYRIN